MYTEFMSMKGGEHMNYTKKMIAYFIANTLALYILNMFAPDQLVLGRGQISTFQALLTTSFGLTLAVMLFDLMVYDFKVKLDFEKYVVLEALVDIGALYLFARTPLQNSIAVGIGAFWVAIAVGLVLSLVQYGVKFFVEHRLK
jgi:hypothetical protein